MADCLQPIVVIGAGDYAQEVAWIIDDINAAGPVWDLLGFVDPPAAGLSRHYERPVFNGYGAVPYSGPGLRFVCGVARADLRRRESGHAESCGWTPAAVVHPSVIQARGCQIAPGTAVGAGTVIGPNARIGRHCAINVQATIGHDALIGDFSVVSPGARISGHVTLEPEVFVGANASIYQGLTLGAGSRLGAGSFLETNLAAGQSVIGVPARPFCPLRPPRRDSPIGRIHD